MTASLISVHVSGLPHDTTKKELEDLFQDAGNVKNVYIADHTNGIDPNHHQTTYGFVRYASVEESEKAIDLFDKWKLRTNHTLHVSMAHNQSKNAPYSQEERKSSPRSAFESFDPRAVEALERSMSRLGLQGQMSSLIKELSQVEYKQVQNWTYPQEDISVNLKELDLLIQQIEELEMKKTNSLSASGNQFENTQEAVQSLSLGDELAQTPQVHSGAHSTETRGINTPTSFSDKTEKRESSHSERSLDLSGNSRKMLKTDECSVYLGRGGRGHVTSSGKQMGGEKKKIQLPTGRGKVMLEKYKQL